jgi:hypothetical protein
MVYVRLQRNWIDSEGRNHQAGDMVDVDATTLAELEGQELVVEPVSGGWAGPGDVRILDDDDLNDADDA